MTFSFKSTHIDRDDFDADHYADFIRDTHRSRLTLDQLDITNRQLRRKEKLITHIHGLKMKEHTRVKNDFIRKIEEDKCLSNLPSIQETLKAQRRPHVEAPSSSPRNSTQTTTTTKQVQKSQQTPNPSKTITKPGSPRTERSKFNLDKFNRINTLLG